MIGDVNQQEREEGGDKSNKLKIVDVLSSVQTKKRKKREGECHRNIIETNSTKRGGGKGRGEVPSGSSSLSSLLNMSNVDAISSLIHSPRDLKRVGGMLGNQERSGLTRKEMFTCPEPLNLSGSLTITGQQQGQQQQKHLHEDPFAPQSIKSRSTPSSASSASTLSPSSSSGQVSGSASENHHPPHLHSLSSSTSLQVERGGGMNRLNTRVSPLASLLISDLVSVATSGNFSPPSSTLRDTSSCLVNNGNRSSNKNTSKAVASSTKAAGSTLRTKMTGTSISSSKKRHAAEKYQSTALDLSSKKRRESTDDENGNGGIQGSNGRERSGKGTLVSGSKKSKSSNKQKASCYPFEYLTGGKSSCGEKEKPHGLLLRLFPDTFLAGSKLSSNNNPINLSKTEVNGKTSFSPLLLHIFFLGRKERELLHERFIENIPSLPRTAR